MYRGSSVRSLTAPLCASHVQPFRGADMLPIHSTDPVAVVEIAGVYVCYNRTDAAFRHIMVDPRAREVHDTPPIPLQRVDPNAAWDNDHLDPVLRSAVHLWRHGIEFDHLDVGANAGLAVAVHGTFYRQCGWPTRIYAFEPGNVFPLLERTVELNGLADRTTCLRMAANDRTGPVTFYATPSQSPAASMLAAAVNRPGVTERHTTTVQGTAIDDFGTRLRPAPGLVVKIDAEGADFAVLAGMRRTLAERLCLVQIEFTPGLVRWPRLKLVCLLSRFFVVDLGSQKLITRPPTSLTDLLLVPRRLPGADTLIERLVSG
jgi:FkbM family methyltransferase